MIWGVAKSKRKINIGEFGETGETGAVVVKALCFTRLVFGFWLNCARLTHYRHPTRNHRLEPYREHDRIPIEIPIWKFRGRSYRESCARSGGGARRSKAVAADLCDNAHFLLVLLSGFVLNTCTGVARLWYNLCCLFDHVCSFVVVYFIWPFLFIVVY